jgi:hypothetical protein
MTLPLLPTLLLLVISEPVEATTAPPVGAEEPAAVEPEADATTPTPSPAAPRTITPREPGLRPSTKPHELGVGLGPRISLPSGGVLGTLPLHYLYHLQGAGTGPAVGGVVDFAFTRNVIGTVIGTQVGPAFRWDVQLIDDVGLYVGPHVAAGYGLYAVLNPGYDPFVHHGGFLQVAGNVRLALDDVGFVFARPVQLTAVFMRGGAGVTYDIVLGGGFTF